MNFNGFIQKMCRKFVRSIQKNVYPKMKFQNFKIENISFSWKPKIKEEVLFCKLISNIPLTNGKARYSEDGDRQLRWIIWYYNGTMVGQIFPSLCCILFSKEMVKNNLEIRREIRCFIKMGINWAKYVLFLYACVLYWILMYPSMNALCVE